MELCKPFYPELEDIREPTDEDIDRMNRAYFRPVKSFNKKGFPKGFVRRTEWYAMTARKPPKRTSNRSEWLIVATYAALVAALLYLAFS